MSAGRRSIRRDRGAAFVLVAIALPVLVLMTAFAVDLGRQRADRRSMQAAADVVALDMVRIVEGRKLSEVHSDPDTQLALSRSADRNGLANATLSPLSGPRITLLEWGTLEATTHDFLPLDPLDAADGATVPEAVRITAEDTTDYAFQPGSGSVTRTAVASLSDFAQASFLLGSTLVSMSPTSNWIIGRVLRQVIPDADLIGHQGFANTSVSLRSLSAALSLGSPDQLADTTVTFRQLMLASATAVQAEDSEPHDADERAAAAEALNGMADLDFEDFDVNVGDALGLGTVNGSGLDGFVSIPQLLISSISVANGINAITIPGTEVDVLGLASVTLDLSAIEAPIRIGMEDGASGTTEQIDLGVTIEIDVAGNEKRHPCDLPSPERDIVGGLIALVSCTVRSLVPTEVLDVRVQGTIDLDLTLAEVTATQAIACPDSQLNIAFDTQPGSLSVASHNLTTAVTFGGESVPLLEVGLPQTAATITGTDGIVPFRATDDGPKHSSFAEILADGTDGGPTARVGSPYLGMQSLLPDTGVTVKVADIPLPTLGGWAKTLLTQRLNAVIDDVDQKVIAEISKLLGLNLGGADITPQSMQCEDNGVQLVG